MVFNNRNGQVYSDWMKKGVMVIDIEMDLQTVAVEQNEDIITA